MAKVLVLAEHDGKSLREITFELLGMARSLAGADGKVVALLLGDGVSGLADKLAARGADEVLYAEGSVLSSYNGEAYRTVIEPALRELDPDLVLVGHTPNGWDVAPLVAGRLGVPVATGCSKISLDGSQGRFTRKAFNGKFVYEVEMTNARPMIATVDKGASAPFEGTTSGSVRKIDADVEAKGLRSRYVSTKKGESSGLDLTQAPIIVAAGRGVGAPEKMEVVRELASALGAQIGASRAVTDAGWLPHEHQIGSSGVSVSPKLYIACGISGAIQHVVGMKGSGYIVAVNKDPDAPIFGVADVGVVGDLFEIVPALTKAIQEAKG